MIRFDCDYTEGCVRKVLDALVRINMEQTCGYGLDEHCENARSIIRGLCGREDIDVHFLSGGTQTNLTVITAALRPHQGVVSAVTGHVNVHESGAIEATGHKVLTVRSLDGTISADQIRGVLSGHFDDPHAEHTVQPGLVYLSLPTESGTLYTAKELTDISDVCREYGVYLYVDGARLGYAMAADPGITFELLARVTDAFYIGGTKVGLLFGEALVISNETLKKDFRYILKQRGGMLAKGRMLGVQFEELLSGGTYVDIARHAVTLAQRIRDAGVKKGWPLYVDSPTNQQFFIVPNEQLEVLGKKYAYDTWERVDEGHTAIRLCTSWATDEKNVEKLVRDIEKL